MSTPGKRLENPVETRRGSKEDGKLFGGGAFDEQSFFFPRDASEKHVLLFERVFSIGNVVLGGFYLLMVLKPPREQIWSLGVKTLVAITQFRLSKSLQWVGAHLKKL